MHGLHIWEIMLQCTHVFNCVLVQISWMSALVVVAGQGAPGSPSHSTCHSGKMTSRHSSWTWEVCKHVGVEGAECVRGIYFTQLILTGTRCTDLTLLSSYDNSSVIQCTTGPEPSPTAYYPGECSYAYVLLAVTYGSLTFFLLPPRWAWLAARALDWWRYLTQ